MSSLLSEEYDAFISYERSKDFVKASRLQRGLMHKKLNLPMTVTVAQLYLLYYDYNPSTPFFNFFVIRIELDDAI